MRTSRNIAACILTALVAAIGFGCASITPTQGVLLKGAGELAQVAGTAAATAYGGPLAGQLASAGLSALGSVMQGYVNSRIPAAVVVASPGVANIGAMILPLINRGNIVTQSDVNTVNLAASIAAK